MTGECWKKVKLRHSFGLPQDPEEQKLEELMALVLIVYNKLKFVMYSGFRMDTAFVCDDQSGGNNK